MLTPELQLLFLSLNKQYDFSQKMRNTASLLFSIGFFTTSGSSKAKLASAENPHETVHELVGINITG
ncbi:hypothetical protein OE09_2067 [Flavobacteriaceae bacterium MAR_2010_72]|nr:hypothetical protein OE09_2067 [Flavobacteriaceae bacterium MAR_2010_72]TVZ59209.1 hypothetical protein NA63_1736 [Flavobacteriaceae bacterium MAR_2010_105]